MNRLTPQAMLEAIVGQYCPDTNQEIERLEREFAKLTYDGTDPVNWASRAKGLVTKLTNKNAAPNDRTIRNTVLTALEEENSYKIRVEIIRHNTPNITVAELWAEVAK